MEETMKRYAFAAAAAVFVWATALAPGARAEETALKSLRAFYFGNSLTGCTNPQWHADLGASAGKQWTCEAMLGAGWPLWSHRRELNMDGFNISTGPRGDLTIDPEFVESASFKARQFYRGSPWDAIVMQPFSSSLERTVTEMWGTKFDRPTDVGDVAAASDLIALYLKTNPKGRACVYADWPPMPAGKIPPEDERPEWARVEGVRIAAAEFPRRDEFDYEQEWLGKKFSQDNPDRPWLDDGRCRDYHYQLFEALKAKFPELWQQGRLRMIPTGDVFMALDRKMQAGQVSGVATIKDYYTDVQHIRAGLPRYTAAASFFAVLFEEHPKALDWQIYNDESKYGEDPHHDKYPFVAITPERVQVVNDTIWEVVAGHPYTRIGRAD